MQDEDDSSSVTSLDPKTRVWLLHAAKNEYQPLAKLAAECPRLVRARVSLENFFLKDGAKTLCRIKLSRTPLTALKEGVEWGE